MGGARVGGCGRGQGWRMWLRGQGWRVREGIASLNKAINFLGGGGIPVFSRPL